jgi:hypothetical protein
VVLDVDGWVGPSVASQCVHRARLSNRTFTGSRSRNFSRKSQIFPLIFRCRSASGAGWRHWNSPTARFTFVYANRSVQRKKSLNQINVWKAKKSEWANPNLIWMLFASFSSFVSRSPQSGAFSSSNKVNWNLFRWSCSPSSAGGRFSHDSVSDRARFYGTRTLKLHLVTEMMALETRARGFWGFECFRMAFDLTFWARICGKQNRDFPCCAMLTRGESLSFEKNGSFGRELVLNERFWRKSDF